MSVYGKMLIQLAESHLPEQNLERGKDSQIAKDQFNQLILVLNQTKVIHHCMENKNEKICDKALSIWTKSIHSLLGVTSPPTVHWMALQLYNHTFSFASYEFLHPNLESWIQKDLLPIFQKKSSPLEVGMACVVYATLASKAVLYPDTKTIFQPSLDKFLNAAMHAWPEETKDVLDCMKDSFKSLAVVMKYFGSSMKPHLLRIENLCFLCLERDMGHRFIDEALVEVLSTIPFCTNDAEYWKKIFEKMIAQQNKIIDNLYEGLETSDIPKTQLTIKDSIVDSTISFALFRVFVKAIEVFFHPSHLNTHFAVEIPFEDLLQLIFRVLNVHISPQTVLELDSTKHARFSLFSLIPSLHLEAYTLLDIIITSLKEHISPFCQTICSLLMRPLDFKEETSDSVIIKVYELTQHYLDALAGCIDYNDSFIVPLIKILLKDIHPSAFGRFNSSDMTLNFLEANKPRKRRVQTKSVKSTKSTKPNLVLNDSKVTRNIPTVSQIVSEAALGVLEKVILHTGVHLSHQVRLKIDHTIITILLNFTKYNLSSSDMCDYRKGLYKCLIACILRPIPSQAPPLAYASRILAVGTQDKSFAVKEVCKMGVVICENLLHPTVPSLSRELKWIEPRVVEEKEKDDEDQENEDSSKRFRHNSYAPIFSKPLNLETKKNQQENKEKKLEEEEEEGEKEKEENEDEDDESNSEDNDSNDNEDNRDNDESGEKEEDSENSGNDEDNEQEGNNKNDQEDEIEIRDYSYEEENESENVAIIHSYTKNSINSNSSKIMEKKDLLIRINSSENEGVSENESDSDSDSDGIKLVYSAPDEEDMSDENL